MTISANDKAALKDVNFTWGIMSKADRTVLCFNMEKKQAEEFEARDPETFQAVAVCAKQYVPARRKLEGAVVHKA